MFHSKPMVQEKELWLLTFCQSFIVPFLLLLIVRGCFFYSQLHSRPSRGLAGCIVTALSSLSISKYNEDNTIICRTVSLHSTHWVLFCFVFFHMGQVSKSLPSIYHASSLVQDTMRNSWKITNTVLTQNSLHVEIKHFHTWYSSHLPFELKTYIFETVSHV